MKHVLNVRRVSGLGSAVRIWHGHGYLVQSARLRIYPTSSPWQWSLRGSLVRHEYLIQSDCKSNHPSGSKLKVIRINTAIMYISACCAPMQVMHRDARQNYQRKYLWKIIMFWYSTSWMYKEPTKIPLGIKDGRIYFTDLLDSCIAQYTVHRSAQRALFFTSCVSSYILLCFSCHECV